jgi:hypothetical protein
MTIPFHGLPTGSLANRHLRLDFLAEAGPRVVRVCLAGSGGNLLAETPDVGWDTPFGAYHLRGGHRLWHAPEAFPRSSIPDDAGLEVEAVAGGVLLRGAVEPGTSLRKTIEIRLDPDRPAVTLTHRLENAGPWPVELAPWAITQLPLGGIAVLPQPATAVNGDLAPNRLMALWPATRLADPRLSLADDFLFVRGQPDARPCKVGTLSHRGWVGYLREGTFLVKRFAPQPNGPYPDLGCNAEVYCNDMFLELETLGPLVRLEPGAGSTHIETWAIYAGLDATATPSGVRGLVETMRL